MKVKKENEKAGLKLNSKKKEMTSENLMHEAEHPKLVLWDNPEGWGGEGAWRGIQDGGTRVHPWLIHVNACQKSSQYCKVIILQLK